MIHRAAYRLPATVSAGRYETTVSYRISEDGAEVVKVEHHPSGEDWTARFTERDLRIIETDIMAIENGTYEYGCGNE
jgi:uncharacterized membrane protein